MLPKAGVLPAAVWLPTARPAIQRLVAERPHSAGCSSAAPVVLPACSCLQLICLGSVKRLQRAQNSQLADNTAMCLGWRAERLSKPSRPPRCMQRYHCLPMTAGARDALLRATFCLWSNNCVTYYALGHCSALAVKTITAKRRRLWHHSGNARQGLYCTVYC